MQAMVYHMYFSKILLTVLKNCVHIHSIFERLKTIVFILNLLTSSKYLYFLTELMNLSLNKLMTMYEKKLA